MVIKHNWKKINEQLDFAKLSMIGCILPIDIEMEVSEALDMAFNKVSIDPKSDNFIKKLIIIGKNNKFSDEQLNILEGVFSEAKRNEIIGRIGVILWFERKNFKAGLKAIDAYKKLFNSEKDNKNNIAVLHVITAYNLMNQLGKKNESTKYIEEIIDDCIEINRDFTYALLDFLVLKEKFSSLSTHAKKKYIEYLDQEANKWETAKFSGELLAKIAQKENKPDEERKAYSYVASFWYQLAQLQNEPMIRRADNYSKAAHFYKKSGDVQKEKYCLKESSLLLQAVDGWHHHREEIDLSPIIEYFKSLDTADLTSCIAAISGITRISRSQIESAVNTRENEFSFDNLFKESTVDEKGTVRSVRDGKLGNHTNDTSDNIPHLMNRAIPLIQLYSQIIRVVSGKYVLKEIEGITFSEIIKPILPNNVQMIDFILTATLSENSEIIIESLMVTFETLLAAIIERSGLPSIKQNEDGTQEDITMGALIDICRKNHFLSKDDLFLIDLLLNNKNGLNLRNLSNHRLTSDKNRASNYYLFCGYFLIRLLIEYGSKNEQDNSD